MCVCVCGMCACGWGGGQEEVAVHIRSCACAHTATQSHFWSHFDTPLLLFLQFLWVRAYYISAFSMIVNNSKTLKCMPMLACKLSVPVPYCVHGGGRTVQCSRPGCWHLLAWTLMHDLLLYPYPPTPPLALLCPAFPRPAPPYSELPCPRPHHPALPPPTPP